MTIAPINDRIGHVGGIESMTVDGRRWYFGFDFSSDMVVSPLIDDPDAMSAFASRYMLQTDGEHDPAYWRELVDMSVEESELCEDEDREFTSARLGAERLTPDDHLAYLLGAATAWDDSFFEEPAIDEALAALGIGKKDHDWECLDTCIAALRSGDAVKSEPARVVMTRYVDFLLDAAPANWPEVFSALRPS